jgi:hypothetical protein
MAFRLRRTPSGDGLREYVLVTALLALAAAGALILYGDQIRGALGLAPAARPGTPSAGQR